MITNTTRKFMAFILLFLLIVVPFIDWRLGAVMWLCAWLVFIFQNISSRQNWNLDGKVDGEDKEKEEDSHLQN